MLSSGAPVNAQGGQYKTALQAAIMKGNHPVARQLIDNGAEINARVSAIGNMFQAAAWRGDKVVKRHIDLGINCNAQDGYYGTALQAAALEGHEAVVRLLLDSGAAVISF